jgi:hypothetical protein
MINRNLYQKGKIISIPNELYLDKAKRLEYIKSEKFQKELKDVATSIVEQWSQKLKDKGVI